MTTTKRVAAIATSPVAGDHRWSHIRFPLRRSPACAAIVISGALNGVVLLAMAAAIVPGGGSRVELRVVFDAVCDRDDELTLLGNIHAPVEASIEILPRTVPELIGQPGELEIPLLRPDSDTASHSAPPAPFSIKTATTLDQAAGRIAAAILNRLSSEDLLVVWLLDGSQSMKRTRKDLAAPLQRLVQEITVSSAAVHHELFHAAVSYAASTREQVAPTSKGRYVPDAVLEIAADPSGRENVFAAIEKSVEKYRDRWDGQMMVVVWTDESGDDAARVEQTVRICREHEVSIYVVGPSAVLGGSTGLHSYEHPDTGQVFQLPVTRGPDSALPERLELGYWFATQEFAGLPGERFGTRDLPEWYGNQDTSLRGHRCFADIQRMLPAWYGGPHLDGLASGFSPYALTRLALQTGGSYIIFDREENRPPFRLDDMLPYLPDYQSAERSLDDVRSHPLRRAVIEAVEVTRRADLDPPPTMLFGRWADFPPYGFMRLYLPPPRFASHFRSMRRSLKDQAARKARVVERALEHLSEGRVVDKGMEDDHRREPSPRWRAWYDLTRGRLLAASVRLEEYRLACDAVLEPGCLNDTTNHLILVPSAEMRSGASFHRRAAEARRLLVRCIREHPDTPWAWLAQRELDYHPGIAIRQLSLTSGVMPSTPAPLADLPRL